MNASEDACMESCAFLPLPPDGFFLTSMRLERCMPLLTSTKLFVNEL